MRDTLAVTATVCDDAFLRVRGGGGCRVYCFGKTKDFGCMFQTYKLLLFSLAIVTISLSLSILVNVLRLQMYKQSGIV